MASFEPTILIFGSVNQIAAASTQFRLPISFSFAFDVKTLEELINVSPALTDIQLNRFFIVLLEPVQNEIAVELEKNHRVVSVYYSDRFLRRSQSEINRRTNSFRQLSLDVTKDIIQFFTVEGQKQVKFERTALASIYFKQARVLREWAMSSFRAEPCHILLVPLNSTQEKMDEVQQRLESRLADPSVIVRQLNDYIPLDEQFSSLLPYAKHLFEYEKPSYLRRLIEKLSPIRLYVYGNQLSQLREWNQLMIENEQSVMDDEDNWCAFLQSEPLDDEVKWNFAFALGKTWKVNRVSPISEDSLLGDPRFQSAVLRALQTFAERQMEVTAQIFDWYDECLRLGDFHSEVRSSPVFSLPLRSISAPVERPDRAEETGSRLERNAFVLPVPRPFLLRLFGARSSEKSLDRFSLAGRNAQRLSDESPARHSNRPDGTFSLRFPPSSPSSKRNCANANTFFSSRPDRSANSSSLRRFP